MRGDDAPLIAGRIHGIRKWELTWSRGDAELTGHAGTRWAAGGEPTRGLCLGGRPRQAEGAPHHGCRCGLYALHPWKSALEHGFLWDLEVGELTGSVVGIVEAWGRIEVHADGFRAQFARPIALVLAWVPGTSDVGRARRRLADRYRAELIEVEDGDELIGLCRERGYGLSRPVVGSLLAGSGGEEPPGPPTRPVRPLPRPPAPRPSPPPRPTARSRLAELGEHALTAVAVLLTVAWYGFWAYVAVGIAIAVLSGDFGSSSAASFGDGKLRVQDQALTRAAGRLRYVAIVRNTSERRTAVAAFARGSVRDRDGERVAGLGRRGRVEQRPTLLPGEVGVVADTLPRRATRPLPDRLVYDTEVVARRERARRARPPVAYGEPALDRAGCRMVVAVEARGGDAGRAGISIVTRDAAGEISAAGLVGLGSGAARRGRRMVRFGDPGECPGWLRAVEVHPFLLPEHARRGH